MNALLLNLLIFLLRFSADPALAISTLYTPAKEMDVATALPSGIVKLPENVLPESSGLAKSANGNFWSHNDSGGEAALFEIDSNGNYIQTLPIPNAKNIDWEDLAQDKEQDIIFIGDFGNNANRRKDLTIYKVSGISSADSLKNQTIRFKYPDQQTFPPPKSNRNFDCEAMVFYRDSLFIFSKNKVQGNGFTKRYRLPAQEGDFSAELLDSFFLNSIVTAADISPDGKKLALLTYGHIYIFSHFPGSNFFSGNVLKINIPISQSEAVVFKDDKTIVYTDEPGFLYTIKQDALKIKKHISRHKISDPKIKLIVNPRRNILKIKQYGKPENYNLTLYHPESKEEIFSANKNSSRKIKLSTKNFAPGIYLLRVVNKEGTTILEQPVRIREE